MQAENSQQLAPLPNLDGHLPALDGLRGLAAILVIFVHWITFSPSGNPLVDLSIHFSRVGWIGVDLFFVLSGFLITGILLKTSGRPNYWKNFFMRRVLRIIPLYYTLLIFFLLIVPLFSVFDQWGDFWAGSGHYSWTFWLFLSNNTDALGDSRHRFLDVAWSLCVEENFYLIWPVIVMQYSRRKLKYICIGLIGFSFALRFTMHYILGSNRDLLWMLTPCRFDGLAFGGLMAILLREGPETIATFRRHLPWLLGCGAVGAVFLAVFQAMRFYKGDQTVGIHPGIYVYGLTIYAFFFAMLLTACVLWPAGSLLPRVFCWPWLRVAGKYSYATYLLHKPALFISEELLGDYFKLSEHTMTWDCAPIFALATAILIIMVKLSWVLIESPALSLKRYFKYDR